MKISGSTILITGASGGIGGAIAHELAGRGARLLLVNRNRPRLEAFAATLRQGGAEVMTLIGDLAEPGEVARLAAQALGQAGHIDILINCAGVQTFGFAAGEVATDTTALFQVNTIAPITLINALLPHMLQRGKGQIVNLGSIFGSIGFPCFATYSASKFALRGFSEALRRELAGTGVGVTYVAPRFTRTAFNRSAVTRMANALKMNQDEPEHVAARVVAAIERDECERYLGWPEKLFVRINALLPRLVDPSLTKQAGRMRPFVTESAL